MHILHHLPLSSRMMRPWRLALIIALLVGVVLPQPARAAPTWTNTASMDIARGHHSTTLLPSGKVLVAGGTNGNGFVAVNSAEVYDPSTNTWTTVASLKTARDSHTATLLPNGKVLVAGGLTVYDGASLASAELYDPSANTWTSVAPLNNRRSVHTATLLPDGKVLIVGGHGASDPTTSAEVHDRGLGFDDGWRPTVNTVSSPLSLGNPLSLTGFGLRGYLFTEASGGGTNNSATDYPLVQIRRLDNEQWLWVSPSAFSDTAFTSLPVTNIPAGPALVTVFVNGIPSVSNALVLRVYQYLFLPVVLK